MNNTSILKKCLAELSEPTPRIDYVKGMLETLIEMQPTTYTAPFLPKTLPPITSEIDPGLPPMPDITKIKGIIDQHQ